jgi:hypothetical protein
MANNKEYYGTAPVTYEMEVVEDEEIDGEDIVGYMSNSTDTTDAGFVSPGPVDREETVEVENSVCNGVTPGGLVSGENDEEDEPSFIEEGTLMVGY